MVHICGICKRDLDLRTSEQNSSRANTIRSNQNAGNIIFTHCGHEFHTYCVIERLRPQNSLKNDCPTCSRKTTQNCQMVLPGSGNVSKMVIVQNFLHENKSSCQNCKTLKKLNLELKAKKDKYAWYIKDDYQTKKNMDSSLKKLQLENKTLKKELAESESDKWKYAFWTVIFFTVFKVLVKR